jgi:hypothetical protein
VWRRYDFAGTPRHELLNQEFLVGIASPKFAGSNPAEAVGFLRAKNSSARLPSEGK